MKIQLKDLGVENRIHFYEVYADQVGIDLNHPPSYINVTIAGNPMTFTLANRGTTSQYANYYSNGRGAHLSICERTALDVKLDRERAATRPTRRRRRAECPDDFGDEGDWMRRESRHL